MHINLPPIRSSVKCEIKVGNKKTKLSADKLLLSVGIKPNIENLGLEELSIDMEKGFIRAEVVKYSDFINVGNEDEAKKQGLIKSEGKDYIVQDGDIIHFRYNV